MKDRSQKIHEESVVIEGLGGFGFPYSEILAGGINAINVTLNTRSRNGTEAAMNDIKRYYALMEMVPDRVMLVEEAQDILTAKREGKVGIIFGFQEPTPLEESKTVVSTPLYIFHKLGLRIMQLTYNDANLLGCGCTEPTDTGLTSFGIQVVQVMNRLGIVVDLSHVGYQTSRDAIEVSEDPVIFSHSNPLALKDVPRNVPDDVIRMAAEKGGVMGVTPYAAFCKSASGKRPTMEDFLDQIDYVVQLVGVDHVGIGTDKFEGRTKLEHYASAQTRYPKLMVPFEHRHVEEFSSIRDWPRFSEGLLSRGYSDGDCSKMIGGNFYSLFEKVWRNPGF
jgi:membrane dipeptidase